MASFASKGKNRQCNTLSHTQLVPTPALQKTSKKAQTKVLTWPVFGLKQFKSINDVLKTHIAKYYSY